MTTRTPLNSRSCDPLRGGKRDLAAGGTRSDLFIVFTDRTDVIRVEGWSPEMNVGITLAETITPPATTSTGAQAGAFDILDGTSAAEEPFGLTGNDGLSGGDGDDLLPPPSIVPDSVEAARDFSWVASRAVGQRWSADDIYASMLGVEARLSGLNRGWATKLLHGPTDELVRRCSRMKLEVRSCH